MSDRVRTPDSSQQTLPLEATVDASTAVGPAADSARTVFVSVVVPVFNEEQCVEPMIERTMHAMRSTRREWEIVVVDDGSSDRSLERALAASRGERRVRVIRIRRNSGQSAALDAGFRAARGEWIVTLDADLQNPPEEIPRLLESTPGTDMVYGRRARRRDSFVKRASSRVGNGVRNLITGHDVKDTGCSLKAFRREAAVRLPTFKGVHRFLPSLFAFHGYRIREIEVQHAERHAGVSKYGVGNRAWRGLVDCFGVRWLKSRALRYEVDALDGPGENDPLADGGETEH